MEEKVLLDATLVYLVTDTHVLLARKVKKIGRGKWMGYGGGIEPTDADHRAAVLREIREESGGVIARPESLRHVALVDFHNVTHVGERFTCRVRVYLLTAWEGEPQDTPEMVSPTWFRKDDLPLDELMPADPDWLPRVLAGEIIYAEAWYGPEQKTIVQPTQVRIVHPDEFNRL